MEILLYAAVVGSYLNLILASILSYRRGDIQRAIFWLVATIALHQLTNRGDDGGYLPSFIHPGCLNVESGTSSGSGNPRRAISSTQSVKLLSARKLT